VVSYESVKGKEQKLRKGWPTRRGTWRWTRYLSVVTLASCFTTALLLAQRRISPDEVRVSSKEFIPPGAAAIHVSANVVDVDFVVRDSRGHAIGNLRKDDFEVYDRGRKREFAAFSEESGRTGTSLHKQAGGANRATRKSQIRLIGRRFQATFRDCLALWCCISMISTCPQETFVMLK